MRMSLPNIFKESVLQNLEQRISELNPDAKATWGTMSVEQMLAHLNSMFDLALGIKKSSPNLVLKFILKKFVKPKLIGETPYMQNARTAPEMVITHQPDFREEKQKLLQFLMFLRTKGVGYFQNLKHPLFGAMSPTDWSNLFYKHIDHHMKQFNA